MKNMSFALTTPQMRARTKKVTRRLGSATAHVGELRQPVVKGMGLKKGETVEKINGPIRFVDVRRERLDRMVDDPEYGRAEVIKEGFPELSPAEFVVMFCQHNRCAPFDRVARIEFEFVDPISVSAKGAGTSWRRNRPQLKARSSPFPNSI